MSSIKLSKPTLCVYNHDIWFSDDPWGWFKPIIVPPMPSMEEINVTMEELRKDPLILESKYGSSVVSR